MSNCSRPQVGQAISTGPRSRSWRALRISQATLTSPRRETSKGDADGVADAVGQQRAQPHRGLQRARPLRPRLGDAEVQRIRDALGEQPVGGDRVRHVGRLDRDLEVLELAGAPSAPTNSTAAPTSASTGFSRSSACRCSGSDPELTPMRIGLPCLVRQRGHLRDLLGAAHVARVQAHAVRAGLDRLQREGVVEVGVGDHRDRGLLDDRLERLDVLVARNRDPDDVRRRRRPCGSGPSWPGGWPFRSWSWSGP